MAATLSSSPSVRAWRTAFLTLRDETLTTPPTVTVIHLLHRLIFSQSETLIGAAPHVSPNEVTADVVFLMKLTRTVFDSGGDDDAVVQTFTQLSQLMYSIRHVSFEMTSSSWSLFLDSFRAMIEIFFSKSGTKKSFLGNLSVIKAIKQCLESIRSLSYQRSCLLSENTRILDFLVGLVSCSQFEIIYFTYSSGKYSLSTEFEKVTPQYNNLWENQSITFAMIGEVFSKVGTSLPVDKWQSTIEIFRKVMDALASKGLLAEDNTMSRFYTSLLNCLHLVLVDPKGSLSDHVAGLVAALRMFLNYGLGNSKRQVNLPVTSQKKEIILTSPKSNLEESIKPERGAYRPPHLRKNFQKDILPKNPDSQSFSDNESCLVDYFSSDSDYSDSEGSAKDSYNISSAKVRVAAIVCLQDLCRADPKLFTAQWTMLLPSSDVLQPRKFEPTLSMCLLFDPYLKARIAAASTIATMLDGPASVFLQVAEYKESSKCGSFTSLSLSLGQILMQLHKGILYSIKHETRSGLLASLFKILTLLISSTPYSRMPDELLPVVITSLQARIEQGFTLRGEQTGMLAVAINCLTAALSASPSSSKVKDIFVAELSTGLTGNQGKSGVLSSLFQYSDPATSPAISFEALQAIRAVAHNYPSIIILCWERISSITFEYLSIISSGVPSRWKGNLVNNVTSTGEKVTTAAIKVLDECLRAISGFKGTEDLLDDKLHDNPFTSDYIRMKTISSAPSYGSVDPALIVDENDTCQSGRAQWCEAIDKHIPLILSHTLATVRAASVTCFAGITSSVFVSLPMEKKDFILTNSINAAVRDQVPSVRSAACRAIGVMACFPQISRSAEILDKLIHAIEINTRDPLVSVRITAAWALANICDSFRHCSIDSKGNSNLITLLIESALRLTKDGDKIKANAVRALGNLSRCVQLSVDNDTGSSVKIPSITVDSDWLDRMVQAFLSCVTTGNVKVQWNVCHALSNLFLNETLRLQDMDWAPSVFSILLLLLRDSSNFKIRIQAAAALAVPATIQDYGRSFADVVQGVEHILENLNSYQISAPSSFKYRIALEKQLTSTMLHVLGLASRSDNSSTKDFLVKKSSFLADWLKMLCSSVEEAISQLDIDQNSTSDQKKEVISKAIKSLLEVYESRNHHNIAHKFKELSEI